MQDQVAFFGVDERLKELSAKGDDLERLRAIVDFKLFRPDLTLAVPGSDGSKGGRPPLDPGRVDFSPRAAAVGAAWISADTSFIFVAGVWAETALAVAIARLARTSVRLIGALLVVRQWTRGGCAPVDTAG